MGVPGKKPHEGCLACCTTTTTISTTTTTTISTTTRVRLKQKTHLVPGPTRVFPSTTLSPMLFRHSTATFPPSFSQRYFFVSISSPPLPTSSPLRARLLIFNQSSSDFDNPLGSPSIRDVATTRFVAVVS